LCHPPVEQRLYTLGARSSNVADAIERHISDPKLLPLTDDSIKAVVEQYEALEDAIGQLEAMMGAAEKALVAGIGPY
jgi:sialic acid synthase SpsE